MIFFAPRGEHRLSRRKGLFKKIRLHFFEKMHFKRNPPLDRDPACEGLLIKYYIRYKHNKDNEGYKHNRDYVKSRTPSAFRARIKDFCFIIKIIEESGVW